MSKIEIGWLERSEMFSEQMRREAWNEATMPPSGGRRGTVGAGEYPYNITDWEKRYCKGLK